MVSNKNIYNFKHRLCQLRRVAFLPQQGQGQGQELVLDRVREQALELELLLGLVLTLVHLVAVIARIHTIALILVPVTVVRTAMDPK